MSKYLKILGVWVFAGVVLTLFLRSELESWSMQTTNMAADIEFDFEKGTSLNKLAKKFEQLKVVDSALKFKWYIKIFSDYSRFQAGHYLIETDYSAQEIVEMLSSGKSYSPVILTIVII